MVGVAWVGFFVDIAHRFAEGGEVGRLFRLGVKRDKLVAQGAHFEVEGGGAGDAGLVLGRVGAAHRGAAQVIAVVEAQAEGQVGVEGD